MYTLIPVLLVGCAANPGVPRHEVRAWLGDDPHFRAVGTLGEEDLDLDLADFSCGLEWETPLVDGEPDYTSGAMTEVQLVGWYGDRELQLELKRHDFQRDELPVDVTVVPLDEATDPRPDELWAEWEWSDAAGADLYEESAVSGAVTLSLLTGSVDETGLVYRAGTVVVGGYLDARWSPAEALQVSFTAPCDELQLEEVEP